MKTLRSNWVRVAEVVASMVAVVGVALALFVGYFMFSETVSNQQKDRDETMLLGSSLVGTEINPILQPWISYYNSGTILARNGYLFEAEYLLMVSLEKVYHTYSECFIRNNLAFTQEKIGDSFMLLEEWSLAESSYRNAVTTISDAPPECFPPPENNQDSDDEDGRDDEIVENAESMEGTKERSEDKEAEAQSQQSDSGGKDSVRDDLEKTDENNSLSGQEGGGEGEGGGSSDVHW